MSNSFRTHLVGALAIAVLGAAPIHVASAQKPLSGLATRNTRDGDTPAPDPAPRADADPNAIRQLPVTEETYRIGHGTVRFYWTPLPTATSYMLGRATTPAGPYSDVHAASRGVFNNRESVDDRAPVIGQPQYYRLSLLKGTQVIAQSAPVPVTIASLPRGITNLAASSPTHGTVVLTWTPDPEATGYTIHRQKTGGDLEAITPTPVKQSSYTDRNLWDGASYSYDVRAIYPDKFTDADAIIVVKVGP